MSKIIAIDYSAFLFMSAHASTKMNVLPTYLALKMMLSNLKMIGVSPEDKIFLCCDFGKSWRKTLESAYKADRAEKRKKSGIDFDRIFKDFNIMLERLNDSVPWWVLKEYTLEADDWMSGLCRYYKDNEVILLTADSDLEQMFHLQNVKIFSPHRLLKRYKIKPDNFNVFKFLAKKINKETVDNLTTAITNSEEYEIRKKIVDLTQLPEWVEQKIIVRLTNLEEKGEDIDQFPFFKLREDYYDIYKSDKILTYEQSVKKVERKQKRKKKKEVENGNV